MTYYLMGSLQVIPFAAVGHFGRTKVGKVLNHPGATFYPPHLVATNKPSTLRNLFVNLEPDHKPEEIFSGIWSRIFRKTKFGASCVCGIYL